jgi:hypothetical protein
MEKLFRRMSALCAVSLALAACGLELPENVRVEGGARFRVPAGDAGEVEAVRDAVGRLKPAAIEQTLREEAGKDVDVFYYRTGGAVVPMPLSDADGLTNRNDGPETALDPVNDARTLFIRYPVDAVLLSDMLEEVEDILPEGTLLEQIRYKGNLTLPAALFGGFFENGDDYQAVTVPCYLYIGGPFGKDGSVVKVRCYFAGDEDDLLVADEDGGVLPITEDSGYERLFPVTDFKKEFPDEPYYAEALPSFTGEFNLAKALNERRGQALELEYEIIIERWVAGDDDADGAGGDDAFSVDLVILLPLRFELDREAEEDYRPGGMAYIRLFEGWAPSSGDVLGRDAIGQDSGRITRVSVEGMSNTVYAGKDVFLRVSDKAAGFDELFPVGEDVFAIEIVDAGGIPYPFRPFMTPYVLQPSGGGAPVVTIKPKAPGVKDALSLGSIEWDMEYERTF